MSPAPRIRSDFFEAFTIVDDSTVSVYDPINDRVFRVPRTNRYLIPDHYLDLPSPRLEDEVGSRRQFAQAASDPQTRELLLQALRSSNHLSEFSSVIKASSLATRWHFTRLVQVVAGIREWSKRNGIPFKDEWINSPDHLSFREEPDSSEPASEHATVRESTPNEVLDHLLVNAQDIITREGDEAFLTKFASTLLQFEGITLSSDEDVVDKLFDQRLSRTTQRVFAAALIRLLATAPDLFERDLQFKITTLKLTDTLPDVLKQLNINSDQQTYLRLQALQSAPNLAMAPLIETLGGLATLAGFGDARQRLRRQFSTQLVQALILPFVPSGLGLSRVDENLRAVQSYLDAAPSEKLRLYREASQSLEEYERELVDTTISFAVKLFRPIAERLRIALHADYSSSPLSKPANLDVFVPEKKYPFCVDGAQVALGFIVENRSAGYALDVLLSAETDARVELAEHTRALGEVAPGMRFGQVEFAGRVLEPTTDRVTVSISLTWTNFDGEEFKKEATFRLDSQSPDIPWQTLILQDPYSLEPVTEDDELLGRSELLTALEGRVRAPRVGSFWVYGQKRVGKTSLVKTLHSRIAKHDPDFVIVYLEVGDYIDPDPRLIVQQLGRKLCEGIKAASPKYQHLQIPDFGGALAPLDDFLRNALAVTPDMRALFILDEFDEIPIDLYRRGGVGDAFFLTLRSISGKPQFGFILVGGENMEFVLSTQGDTLNKFRPIRVDYFDRDTHWSDFEELIRTPVSPWATVSDGAITTIYNATAGNPFFAKLICNTLFLDLVRRRDAFVTEREMGLAIQRAVAEAGPNQFQHFWEDGIFEISGDRIEEKSMRRRRVLIAFAEALRSKEPISGDAVAARARDYKISNSEVRHELADFERRNVLRKTHGVYQCTVDLFQTWLAERGIREIVTSFTDQDEIDLRKQHEEEIRVRAEEIGNLVRAWGVYKGRPVGHESVRAWLNQFGDAFEQRLMFQVLEALRFYTSSAVRAKLLEAHGIVVRDMARRGIARREEFGARKRTDNVLLSYYGGAGKSGPFSARLYADENRLYADRVVSPEALPVAIRKSDDIHAIVIIDDFIGTGNQAESGLRNIIEQCGSLITERNMMLYFVCVSGFALAGERIEASFSDANYLRVHICDPLDEADKCFGETSRVFPDRTERQQAEEIARRYGQTLEPKHPLGYGNTQAAVVFEFNCPNNTLPLLWKSRDGWEPLFPRH